MGNQKKKGRKNFEVMGGTSSRHDFPVTSSITSFSEDYENRNSPGIQWGAGGTEVGSPALGREDVDDSAAEVETLVPTTFSWNLGGHEVFVTGAWDQWQSKQPLFRVGNEHRSVLLLQVGKFQYKYIVDGEWRSHDHQPTERDEHGNENNLVIVTEQLSAFDPNEPPTPNEPLSPIESYDYVPPALDDLHVAEVPELPAHYHDPILNKNKSGGEKLPVPSHVCVGHLQTATRHYEGERVTVFGVTQRWRGKFVTTVIYTPRGETD